VLEQVDMPAGVGVSGLESDGRDTFYCGGGNSGTLRACAARVEERRARQRRRRRRSSRTLIRLRSHRGRTRTTSTPVQE
jgi:hypothetical protein